MSDNTNTTANANTANTAGQNITLWTTSNGVPVGVVVTKQGTKSRLLTAYPISAFGPDQGRMVLRDWSWLAGTKEVTVPREEQLLVKSDAGWDCCGTMAEGMTSVPCHLCPVTGQGAIVFPASLPAICSFSDQAGGTRQPAARKTVEDPGAGDY